MSFLNIITLSLLSILLISSSNSLFNFRNSLKQAINKAKNLYKSHFTKDKTWHFLGHDPTEYPGTNEELRKINSDNWQEYYNCLKRQVRNLENHGSIIPEAILAFEGQSVTFECKVCLSPSERSDVESVEWEWSSADKKYLEPLEYTEHILVSPEEKTLHLYNLGTQQTGQYVCKLKNQLAAPYFLTVVNALEPLKEVHKYIVPNTTHPELPWLIHTDVILDTLWGKWTPCSNCDVVGKKHKVGYCIIVLLKNLEHDISDALTMKRIFKKDITTGPTDLKNNDPENSYIEIENFVDISASDIEILHIFKYGIPCRSHILPNTIKNIPEIRTRKSELMTGYCKVECTKPKLFVVEDKDGKVIETANNTAGIYSMLQGLPTVEPSVDRMLKFEAADKKIVLTCPGNLNTETPIQWQIGSKKIVPSLLAKETGGRMYITILEKLAIEKARISDSNIYSCWQNKELAGTIRLVVEKRLKLDFNHHIMLMGIVIIMSIFLYVFIRAFFGRKYAII